MSEATPQLSKPNTPTCLVERDGTANRRIEDPDTPDRASSEDYTDIAELVRAGVHLDTAIEAAMRTETS